MKIQLYQTVNSVLCLTVALLMYCGPSQAVSSVSSSEWVCETQGVAARAGVGSQVNVKDPENIMLVSGELLIGVSQPSAGVTVRTSKSFIIIHPGNTALIRSKGVTLQVANISGPDDGIKVFVLDPMHIPGNGGDTTSDEKLSSASSFVTSVTKGNRFILSGNDVSFSELKSDDLAKQQLLADKEHQIASTPYPSH